MTEAEFLNLIDRTIDVLHKRVLPMYEEMGSDILGQSARHGMNIQTMMMATQLVNTYLTTQHEGKDA